VRGAIGLNQYLGARRNGDLEHRAVGAVALCALPMATALGAEVRAAPKVFEVAVGVVADQHDVAAMTAVAAVGSALGHVGFAPEAHASVAAATGLNVYSCSIFHMQVFL
jgi:hypothetical protein